MRLFDSIVSATALVFVLAFFLLGILFWVPLLSFVWHYWIGG